MPKKLKKFFELNINQETIDGIDKSFKDKLNEKRVKVANRFIKILDNERYPLGGNITWSDTDIDYIISKLEKYKLNNYNIRYT